MGEKKKNETSINWPRSLPQNIRRWGFKFRECRTWSTGTQKYKSQEHSTKAWSISTEGPIRDHEFMTVSFLMQF